MVNFFCKKIPSEHSPNEKQVLVRVDFKMYVNFQCILIIMRCFYMPKIDLSLSFTTMFC